MEGFSQKLLILTFIFGFGSSAIAAKNSYCNFGCKDAEKSVLDTFLLQKKQCSYLKNGANEDRGLSFGARETQRINIDSYSFLKEALRIQGLRPSPDPKYDFASIQKLGTGGDCFYSVDPFTDLKSGDIVIGKNQILILDEVGSDPYAIADEIENQGSKVKPEKLNATCDDWTADASKFKITAYHEVYDRKEKTKSMKSEQFVPALGSESSSSVWVTFLHERAKQSCIASLSQKMHEPLRRLAGIKSPGLQVLRHQTDQESCRIPCTECCDHQYRSGKGGI